VHVAENRDISLVMLFDAGRSLEERVLAEQFGVSRPSLREAIQKMAAKGLLVSRQGGGNYVAESMGSTFSDPLLPLLEANPEAQRDLLEFRHTLEGSCAYYAALRATEADLAPMEDAFARMSKAKQSQDFSTFNQADIDFHTALLRASGNVVFQQLSNTIGAALAYSFRLTVERAREPGASLANHGEVIERIRHRDSEGAYASMARLLNIAIVDLGLSGMQDNSRQL